MEIVGTWHVPRGATCLCYIGSSGRTVGPIGTGSTLLDVFQRRESVWVPAPVDGTWHVARTKTCLRRFGL